MTEAKPLPSGSWRAVGYYYVNGKRKGKSFTSDDKHKANLAASEFEKAQKKPPGEKARDSIIYEIITDKKPPVANITLKNALELYVKAGVTRKHNGTKKKMSPSTIGAYDRAVKSYSKDENYKGLLNTSLNNLTNEMLQNVIDNDMDRSPKTKFNFICFVSAALKVYHPSFDLDIALPEKIKPITLIPTPEQVVKIFDILSGTEIELPVLLCIYLGISASELRGLRYSNIQDDGRIMIREANVRGLNGWEDKAYVKNEHRQRAINLPTILLQMLGDRRDDEHIVKMTGNAIYERFKRLLIKNGLPPFKLHAMRHLNTSVAIISGLPDKYMIERGGWSTDSMIQTTYGHTMGRYEKEYDNRIYGYFDDLRNKTISEQKQGGELKNVHELPHEK